MDSRRILITGLSSWWGGRLAQVLEHEPGVEAVIGIDTRDPKHALDRTEFVRVETDLAILRRIIAATAIDTVVDPRLQFVHDEDVVGVFAHIVRNPLPGYFNVAADGVLALSEIASLLGKPMLPLLPPWGVTFAAAQLRRLGVRVPVEMVRQLRYG